MEEAFTSEHWIVRIYKVKPRPNLDPTATAAKKKKTSTSSKKKGAQQAVDEPAEEARFVGCFMSETSFSSDKIYEGGTTGANYGLALHHAKTTGKRELLSVIYLVNLTSHNLTPHINHHINHHNCLSNPTTRMLTFFSLMYLPLFFLPH